MATILTAPDVSSAWMLAARHLASAPGHETYDLIVEMASPWRDDPGYRETLNGILESRGNQTVDAVANTIFPESIWRTSGNSAQRLYERYDALFAKRLHRLRGNAGGIYFHRLIHWNDGPDGAFNQIQDVIRKLRVQTSGLGRKRFIYDLQVFDPWLDRNPRGFPCLTYMNLKRQGSSLLMTAHYRNHYFVERAYGNYLGLGRLLVFIAHEAGLEPGRLLCVSGHAVLDGTTSEVLNWIDKESPDVVPA